MKKKILVIILFVIGFGIFITPYITDYLYNARVNKLEDNYNKTIKATKKDKYKLLNDLMIEENNKLYENKQRTFINHEISFEETLIDLTKYGFEDRILGFIEIPSIDVKLPIYLGASNKNMKLGAVHLTGTSYPIGGKNTNSVIAAHRGYYKTLMFRHINKIKIGDVLYIKNYNGTLEYKAIRIDIINPTELDKLTIEKGKDMVTIISCHPFPYNYQRYVVYFART